MTITEVIYNYLKTNLDVPVYTLIPKDKPTSFVVIDKTNGGEDEYIYNSLFAIQSYGNTLADADELNDEVKAVMRGIVSVDMIISCKLNSDYNFTDTTTKEPRYQAVFEVRHY